jgi:hypothetical protein
MNWPNVSTLGLTALLPQITNVSYTSVNNAGNQNFTLSWVVTTPSLVKERQISFGVYKFAETTFKIDPAVWTAASPISVPKPRDLLTDANGDIWRVSREFTPTRNGVPWKLVCSRLIIESTLCDTISIKKPVDSRDNYLSPLTAQGNPSSPETNIPCRIQLASQSTEDFQGIQFQRSYYKIYVATLNDNLSIGTVVLATSGEYNGQVFRVVSNDNIEQLEELEMLTVTIDPVS